MDPTDQDAQQIPSTGDEASEGALAQSGMVEETDEQGCVLMRCDTRSGMPHGLMQRFDEQGRLQVRARFEDGKLHGLLQVFDDRGELSQEIEYAQGVQHGVLRVHAACVCVAEQSWVLGQLTGPALSRDAQGELTARMHYLGGELDGLAEFYAQGQRVRTVEYRQGLLHGLSCDYDVAGNLVQSATYESNRLHGPLRRYWPSGKLMEETVYEAGRPVGATKRLDAQGRAVNEAQGVASVSQQLRQLMRGV